MWNEYHTPLTLDEAVALLGSYDGRARVVAGGTDLFVDMQHGHHADIRALVDVTQIQGLNEIHLQDGCITIGAGVTHTQATQSALLQQHGLALVLGCAVVGGPQVRNVGTICGNVAHALPAGDATVALVALDAEGLVASPGRLIWRPILDFYRGPGQSALDSTRELLAAVRFKPTGVREASCFARIMRPQGVALPILGAAVRVRLTPDMGFYEAVRISLGPVGTKPYLAEAAAGRLCGGEVCDASIESCIQGVLVDALPRTSPYRATARYRQEMIGVLLRQTLSQAAALAKQASHEPGLDASPVTHESEVK